MILYCHALGKKRPSVENTKYYLMDLEHVRCFLALIVKVFLPLIYSNLLHLKDKMIYSHSPY
jgi:hypothetical protein